MSYSVIKSDGFYNLYEKESSIVIQIQEPDESKIRSVCRKLNLGSGFNGWTPAFIAKKMFTSTK